MRHLLSRLCLVATVLAGSRAFAQVAEPGPRDDDAFDFMNLLAAQGRHDLQNERWNAYGQFTHISSLKPSFAAPYSGVHSLSPDREYSFTTSVTLYLAAKLWRGAEAYVAPEMISLRPLSDLRGLGGSIQNFELQKGGSAVPTVYLSRAFVRQTFEWGQAALMRSSDPMQLGSTTSRRRIVLTVGNFSVLDVFDKNSFSGDLRRQFFNMAFLTYSAFDFAADARGYALGAVAELFHDNWAFRVGRFTPPKQPNQLELDYRFFKYYGDQAELEHHFEIAGHTGAFRVLGYRNRENMGRFNEAVAAFSADQNAATCGTRSPYESKDATAPDLCWARRPNAKMGVGLNLEQQLTAEIGAFARGMVSDGRTEVYSFSSSDRSLSLGAVSWGRQWHRPSDLLGVGFGQSWISPAHADYLRKGGIDGFIGDGQLRQASERVAEVFYSLSVVNPLWVSLDYQHISNPAYNADRGPVHVVGGRVHTEF